MMRLLLGDDWRDTALYFVTGVILGYVILAIFKQTALLEELNSVAHEQKRLLLAAARREMAAAAAKESDSREA